MELRQSPWAGRFNAFSERVGELKGDKRVLLQPADGEADDAIAVAVRRRQRMLVRPLPG